MFFDNLQVVHTHGALLEDNSYYPGGLKMEGISSSAVMVMPDAGDGGSNKYTYQGVYSEWDTDAGWNEFTLRSYDPQINRWTGVDPYDEFASGYVGMGNDPVNMTDPSGGSIFSGLDLGEQVIVGAMAGFFVGMGTAALTGNEEDAWTWGGFGAIIGGGIPLLGSVNWGNNGRTASMREKILGSLLAAASNAHNIAKEAGYNPSADGVRDAIINAVLLGAPNLANELLGIDPLSRYSTEYDKESYSNSRSATDIAIAAAALSVSNGSNAASGAAFVLALAGAETIVISGVALEAAALTKVLSVYSKGVTVAASADAKSIKVKLQKYKKAKAAKTVSNIAKNAKKMSLDDIGDFLNAGKDWHKGSAKKDFLKQFKKELKGDTNADFYFDEISKEVFLKSNKSGNWISTGQKFE